MRKLSFTTLFVLGSTRRFLTSFSVVFADVFCKLFIMAYLLATCTKCSRTTEMFILHKLRAEVAFFQKMLAHPSANTLPQASLENNALMKQVIRSL